MTDADAQGRASMDGLILGAILESAAAAIITIDDRGTVRTANPAAQRLFGYTAAELIGGNVSKLMGADDASRHDGHIARHLATGEARIIGVGREVTGRRKDGSFFAMHLSVGKFASEGRTYFTGVIIDLSKQKAAETGLARQQAFFQSIFESLPDPVIILDTDRRIQFVNPAFQTVFGWAPDALANRSSEELYATREEWVRHAETGLDVKAGTTPQPLIFSFRRADGHEFPGATVRSVIRDRTGSTLGIIKVVRDVSEELSREQALLQSNRMEAIGQLTGGIAHDFNNILTVVLGNVELLEMRLDEPGQIALVREAAEAAEMGARLTDRLLTFARRQHLDVSRINLNEFVLGLIDMLRRTLGEDIDLSTALAGNLWATEADVGQVENALLNLAINARDAMAAGGRLLIETRNQTLDTDAVAQLPELKPGDYVVLAVSDTGHGMPPAVRARAFEPFFTTKGPGKGSGLGLATIYGFAKQSGGHATISSEQGSGTTVELYLPRSARPDETTSPAEPEPERAPARGETILVVEDDDRVRRVTTARLVESGYVVQEARNGVEALAILRGGLKPDLVFSDLVMPGGISGLDLLREVRRLDPKCRFMLTSGYADEFVSNAAADVNSVRLLHKPYRHAELAYAIRQALDEAG